MLKSSRGQRHIVIGLLVTLLVLAACAGNKPAPPNPTATAGPVPPTTQPDPTAATSGAGAIEEDPAHRAIVVNLHLNGAVGGPAYDIYQVHYASSDADIKGVSPAVRGLAFGAFSEPLPLGRRKSIDNTGDFGLTIVPVGGSVDEQAAVLLSGSEGWKLDILVIMAVGGSGPSGRLAGVMEFPTEPGTGGNSLPAPTAGKVTLVAVTSGALVGDENAGTAFSLDDTVLFGIPGKCLASSAPALSGDAASAVTSGPRLGVTPFVVDAGTAKVGFWITQSNQYGPGDCTGNPVAEADVASLAPGSRALVFLYGPSATQTTVLVVPVPE